MKRLLLLCCLLCCGLAQAQTRFYYKDSLYADHYAPQGRPNGISVMFIHGGGFSGGDPANQRPFAEGMSKRGYNVFVISYRLYMKGRTYNCSTVTHEKLKAFEVAAEDGTDAARFILDRADSLQVDPQKFFLAGSSAGAEAALQMLYNPFSAAGKGRYAYFSERPRFAGVLLFAGALVDINAMRPDNWVPTFLMHGTKDATVPYGTSAHHSCKADAPGWLILFGSKTLYEKGKEWNKPVVLYSYKDRQHEVANYMFREFDKIDKFMRDVAGKKKIGAKEEVITK